jgi:hypothetical protein
LTLQQLAKPARLAFTHQHSYGAAPPRWPMLEVELAVTTPGGVMVGRPITTSVLVDSGADITMLDAALAPILGVDLRRCPVQQVQGVGPAPIQARQAIVKMNLCGRWVNIPILFSPNLQPQLLGRAGVFDVVSIAFLHRRNMFLAAAAA